MPTPKGPVFVSAPGRIPYEAYSRYARDRGFDPETFDLLLRYAGGLDDEYLIMHREQMAAR